MFKTACSFLTGALTGTLIFLAVDTWYQYTQGIIVLPADKWTCTEYQNFKTRLDKHEILRYEICLQYKQVMQSSPCGSSSTGKLKNAISLSLQNGRSGNPGNSFLKTPNQCGVKL